MGNVMRWVELACKLQHIQPAMHAMSTRPTQHAVNAGLVVPLGGWLPCSYSVGHAVAGLVIETQ
jgi:hypothetical protein